jgi:hypothetical protein
MLMNDLGPAANDPQSDQDASVMRANGDKEHMVSRQDALVFPKQRRAVVQYLTDESGAIGLYIYYGEKEISFDEPDLFPFGEALVKQTRFTADAALTWSDGYDWSRIQPLLQHLVDEGILVRAQDAEPETVPTGDMIRPSPLPPSTCPMARSWDDCEAITRDLAGHAVEPGYLELIVPMHRLAHPFLDADQRQVGEANVYPAQLRMDVPTEWRICNLPGTRYQSEKPMNVTAMRVMRAHWPQMMAALLRVRSAYLRRFPDLEGRFPVSHIEGLAIAVMALPTYQLMRRQNPVANGNLHPALASLFRVTDGVRMTANHMLFLPSNDATVPPDRVLTVDEILDYVERSLSFHSLTGVCAGPRVMVRELLQLLLEGRGNADYAFVTLEPAVQAALDDLEAVIDYGLLGLRAYSVVFTLWPVMTRAYQYLADSVEALPAVATPPIRALRKRIQNYQKILSRTYFVHEKWRAARESVYAGTFRQCGQGIAGLADEPSLDVLLSPVWTSLDRQTEVQLQHIVRRRFGQADRKTERFVLELSLHIIDFLLRVRAILRTAVGVQHDINRLLGRKPPVRVLSAADIKVYDLMQGDNPDRLPFLFDELEQILGIQIGLDVNRLAITAHDAPV